MQKPKKAEYRFKTMFQLQGFGKAIIHKNLLGIVPFVKSANVD